MRLVNVFFTPHILEHLFKFGSRRTDVVRDAIPQDAQMRGSGFDAARNCFYIAFEHPSFRELQDGELIPEVRPMFTQTELDIAVEAMAAVLRRLASHVHDDGVDAPYPEDYWIPILDSAKAAIALYDGAHSSPARDK